MKSRRTLTIAVAALSLLGLSLPSHAVIISATSDNPYEFNWSYTVIGSDSLQHTLTGFGSLIVSGFNSTSLTVAVSLTNTSLLGGQGGERLTAFGFGIEPNATSVNFVDAADGGMNNAALGQNFPGFQGVDVCARGGSTCAGGSNGGIWAGGTDSFSIVAGWQLGQLGQHRSARSEVPDRLRLVRVLASRQPAWRQCAGAGPARTVRPWAGCLGLAEKAQRCLALLPMAEHWNPASAGFLFLVHLPTPRKAARILRKK